MRATTVRVRSPVWSIRPGTPASCASWPWATTGPNGFPRPLAQTEPYPSGRQTTETVSIVRTMLWPRIPIGDRDWTTATMTNGTNSNPMSRRSVPASCRPRQQRAHPSPANPNARWRTMATNQKTERAWPHHSFLGLLHRFCRPMIPSPQKTFATF